MPPLSESSSVTSSTESLEAVNLQADDEWQDVDPDSEINPPIISLFDNGTFPDVASMLHDCKVKHNVDLVAIVREAGYDFYDCVKLVNYIRFSVKNGNPSPDLTPSEFLSDDSFLKPVLADDALLFNIEDVLDLAHDTSATNQAGEDQAKLPQQGDSTSRVAALEAELSKVRTDFDNYRIAVAQTLDQRWNSERIEAHEKDAPDAKKHGNTDIDSHYFASYAYNEIHEVMLKDTTRTSAYRDFIYDNKHIFAGKTVLDVGCGTGILSMFCAKAGAKKVIAVDNSDIIQKAREIVYENKLSDVITCVHGKIEEVKLPVESVDIIVSEWMGYCLLYEAMLDSVLWARDHYLAPNGLMVPSFAVLHLAPLADPDYIEDSVAYWHEVYGFRMSAMLEKIHDDVLVRTMKPETIVSSSPEPFARLPLHTVTLEDLAQIKADFSFPLSKDIDALDGFAIWFDIIFQTERSEEVPKVKDPMKEWQITTPNGIAFTTGPFGPETHWRTGMLLVNRGSKKAQPLKKGQIVQGNIQYAKRKANLRELEIGINWQAIDTKEAGEQMWLMQ